MTDAGATDVDETSSWPSSLSSYRLVFLSIPETEFSAAAVGDMEDLLADGGVIVFGGESSSYSSAALGVFNTLADDLGLATQFDITTMNSGCYSTASRDETHELSTGAPELIYAATSAIDVRGAGVSVYIGESSQTLVAAERGVIFLADIDLVTDGCDGAPYSGNIRFMENMYDWSPDDACANPDKDGDGYDSEACGGNDCDDDDPDVNPGEYRYADEDGDGYGDPNRRKDACSAPSDWVDNGNDCDDTDRTVTTGDGPFWEDNDGDGYGDPDAPSDDCEGGRGLADNDEDCDDTKAKVNPEAEETCNGRDDDCDGDIDEDGTDATTWYYDGDDDGYGDPEDTEEACDAPEGYVAEGGDCADGDPTVYPGSGDEYTELCGGPAGGRDDDASADEGAVCSCPLTGGAALLVPAALLARRRRRTRNG
jgi:hypothetical protein